jgi:hypothetical protein
MPQVPSPIADSPIGKIDDSHHAGHKRFFSSTLVVGLLAFTLYAATGSRGVLWQDSGMFHLRVFHGDYVGDLGLALSHPLYILLARGFAALIHFGDHAWRVNLFSGLAAAVTVANVFLVVAWLTGRQSPALLAAVSLALAHTFWFHAAVAEVYALYTALLSVELVCLTGYGRTQNPRWLYALALANGLALSDHNFALLVLFCYVVLTVYLLAQKTIRLSNVIIMVFAWILGALPFAALILQQLLVGQSVPDVIRSALFGNFQEAVLNLHISYGRSLLFILLNFSTPNLLLAIPGIAWFWRSTTTHPHPMLRIVSRTMLLMFAVFLIFAIRYRVPDQYAFFMPAYVLVALAIGLGADRFFITRPKWMTISLICTLLPIAAYALSPSLIQRRHIIIPGVTREVPFRDEYRYFLQPWKCNDRGPEEFVEAIRDKIPPGSLILADSTTLRPLLYYQQIKNSLTQYAVYLQEEKKESGGSIELACLQSLRDDVPPCLTSGNLDSILAGGNVYIVTPQPGYCPPWLLDHCRFEPAFPLYRILPRP